MKKDNLSFFNSLALGVCLSFFAVNLTQAKDSSATNIVRFGPAGFKTEPESVASAAGKKLAAKQNCSACHSIEGHGGCLAPPFDGIGARRSAAFMLARISSERNALDEYRRLNPQGELFTHARVPAQQAQSLVSYLLTLAEPAGGFDIAGHNRSFDAAPNDTALRPARGYVNSSQEALSQSIKQGKALFIKRNCLSCHSVGSGGGQFGPRLDGISKRRDRAFIVDTLTAVEIHKLTDDDKNSDKIIMSPSAFSPAQIEKVSDFLISLP